ncbi:NAD(P)-binding protein, partial [Gymnopus androsaceus JB14]
LDLSDLNKVKEAAETFISRSSNLNMLICNAGAMLAPIEELSVQGYDLHFGVNALGHFLFIQKLLPLLKSLSSPTTQSRIVWVSSSAHYYFIHHPINSENLRDTPSRKKLDSFQLYCQSKFVTTMLAYRLAEELDKQLEEGEGSTGNSNKSPNVICIHLDPGNIDTDVWRNMDLSWLTRKFLDLTLYPVSFGVLSQLFAATALEATGYNGKYLQPWARLGEPNPATKDNAEQEKLWTFCMDAIKDYI